MLIRPPLQMQRLGDEFASCSQFRRGYVLECPRPTAAEPDWRTSFASYRGKEQAAHPRLVFADHCSLTDCAGKGLVHRALQLGSKPLNAATPQINVVSPLCDHRSFGLNDAAQALRHGAHTNRSRVRTRL